MLALSEVQSKLGLNLEEVIHESDYSTAYRVSLPKLDSPLFLQKYDPTSCGQQTDSILKRWEDIEPWLEDGDTRILMHGLDGDSPWCLSQYIPGLTLTELFDRLKKTSRTLPVSWMSSILTQICHQLMTWYEGQERSNYLVHGNITSDHIRVGLDGQLRITGWQRMRGLNAEQSTQFNWDAAGFGALAFDCHRASVGDSKEDMSIELDGLARLAIRFQRGLDKERFHLLSRELLSVFPHDWQGSMAGFSAWLSTECPEEVVFQSETSLEEMREALVIKEEVAPVAAKSAEVEAIDEVGDFAEKTNALEEQTESEIAEELSVNPFERRSTSVENFTTDETAEISMTEGWEPILEKMANDGLIERTEMERVLQVYSERGGRIIDVICMETKLPETTITRVIMEATGTPRLSEEAVLNHLVDDEKIMQFPQDFARSRLIVPIQKMNGSRVVLVADPLDRVGIDTAFKICQTAFGDTLEEMAVRVVEKSLVDRAVRKSYAPFIGERRKEPRVERILAIYPTAIEAQQYLDRFKQDGFRVEHETDPVKAVELIRFSPPSAILCAHQLSNDGAFDFIQEIRAGTNHIDLPIFVTGFDGDEKQELLYLDLAVEDVFQLSASLNVLGKKIGRALSIRQRIRARG